MKQVLISESLILQVQKHLQRQAEGNEPWSQEDSKALAAQLKFALLNAKLVQLATMLRGVLCGPEGECSILGSNADRAIIDEVLETMESQAVTPQNLVIDGKYNWIDQPDRLIYIGVKGGWYQFKKIGDARPVWCEVRADSLSSFEQTKD